MTLLVSVEDVKNRLRITHDAEDSDIEAIIHGASAAVLNYLHIDESVFLDSDSEYAGSSDHNLTVPHEVQLAVLVLVGNFYRDREGVDAKDWEHGYLPKPVIALLYPLRDPALG
jgi:hypothetical protein